jgi:cell wall-associated NlpC family hydrolase
MNVAAARMIDGSPLATTAAIEALAAHAREAYPEEALGYIDQAGAYVRLANHADAPERHGVVNRPEMARLIIDGAMRAFCHSHPDGPDCPSEQDMRTQMEMQVPFVLIATNGQACAPAFAWGDELIDDAPLVGRSFRHGVSDCYALIRSWFRAELGAILPDYPRNWEWWVDGTPGEKDIYRRYFAEAGFYEIDPSQVRNGDCWMAAVRSAVPNHAGVYLDGGLALHHPSSGLANDPARLSKREPIARWLPYVTHWVRRD